MEDKLSVKHSRGSEVMDCTGLVQHMYRIGYVTAQREQDYSPLGNEEVRKAIAELTNIYTQAELQQKQIELLDEVFNETRKLSSGNLIALDEAIRFLKQRISQEGE